MKQRAAIQIAQGAFGVMMGAADRMRRKAKLHKTKTDRGSLLIDAAAVLFILFLLLRMIVFVVGRHHG
jgi:hypothetical protein